VKFDVAMHIRPPNLTVDQKLREKFKISSHPEHQKIEMSPKPLG